MMTHKRSKKYQKKRKYETTAGSYRLLLCLLVLRLLQLSSDNQPASSLPSLPPSLPPSSPSSLCPLRWISPCHCQNIFYLKANPIFRFFCGGISDGRRRRRRRRREISASGNAGCLPELGPTAARCAGTHRVIFDSWPICPSSDHVTRRCSSVATWSDNNHRNMLTHKNEGGGEMNAPGHHPNDEAIEMMNTAASNSSQLIPYPASVGSQSGFLSANS